MKNALRRVSPVLALLFLALHLPFLPSSLEDVDSINFALAVRDFDVARHQPHPPGVPIYVAATKVIRTVTGSEVTALSVTAVLAGTASVFALLAFFRRLDPAPQSAELSTFATLLAMTTPLFWFTAARPMNDMPGLAAALGIQALTLSARNSVVLALSAFLGALAAGLRLQVAWLTMPLIVLALLQRPAFEWTRASRQILLALVVGVLIWLIPLVWLTGGPAAYWHALSDQAMEDLTGIVMLWTTPTARQLLRALNREFVAPWGEPAVAFVVIPLAVAGAIHLTRIAPRTLVTLIAAFGPYLVLDVLFQETATVRYALPLTVPMAYLTVRGVDWLTRRQGSAHPAGASSVARAPSSRLVGAGLGRAILVTGLTGANLFVAGHALYGYSSTQAPAFRMLDDMRALSGQAHGSPTPVLAMHRRLEFDLRRPVLWLGDQAPRFETRLASPPKREWLELVKYWNSGRRGEIWFLADPLRSDLALVNDPIRQGTYRWSGEAARSSSWLLTLLGGLRPKEVDWYVMRPPGWYVGEGWELTPETAGVAREAGVGPGRGPILGWIRRQPEGMTVMVGGRNLSQNAQPARLRVAIDDRIVDEGNVSPGSFLKMFTLPPGFLVGTGDYATLTIEAIPGGGESGGVNPRVDVIIEQFDAESTGNIVFGYSEGWHLAEYDPDTGRQWRWTSQRAVVRVRGAAGRPLALRLGGEAEAAARARVTIRAGGEVVAERDIGRQFLIAETIPASLLEGPETEIVIETNQSYVPAERSWRSPDLRRLGLKVFEWRLTPAS